GVRSLEGDYRPLPLVADVAGGGRHRANADGSSAWHSGVVGDAGRRSRGWIPAGWRCWRLASRIRTAAVVRLRLLMGWCHGWDAGADAGGRSGIHVRRDLPADLREQRLRPDGDDAELAAGLCREPADDTDGGCPAGVCAGPVAGFGGVAGAGV